MLARLDQGEKTQEKFELKFFSKFSVLFYLFFLGWGQVCLYWLKDMVFVMIFFFFCLFQRERKE